MLCFVYSVRHDISNLLYKTDQEDLVLISQLWVCKTIINSTLINYNDPALMLIERSNNISSLLKKLSFSPDLINKFQASIRLICQKNINNKFEKVLSVTKDSQDHSLKLGIVGRNLFGNDPACFDSFIRNIGNFGYKFYNITNRSQLTFPNYNKIFIVGASNKISIELIRAVFYSGVTSRIEVFLYEHENFYIPSRIEMPIQTESKHLIRQIKFNNISYDTLEPINDEPDLNNWVEGKIWEDILSGNREKTSFSVASHYILFENGDGVFLPLQGKILHLDKKKSNENSNSTVHELSYVDILELEEGDYLLLRLNNSGFLLNEEINYGDSDSLDDEDVLDKITDWKKSLDALLLTKDYSQIADQINSMGVKVNSSKIKQWNGVDVIAPNSEEEFRALIKVLFSEGKLNSNINDVDLYSSVKWQEIINYRIGRQKAGTKARSNVLDELLLRINGIDLDLTSSYENINLDIGQNFLIRRIAMLDRSISYVHNSELYKINEIRNSKWLR